MLILLSYNIQKLNISVRNLSLNVYNKATLEEDVEKNLPQPVLKKAKFEEPQQSSNKKINCIFPEKKNQTPSINSKQPVKPIKVEKAEKKVSADIKTSFARKEAKKDSTKIITEDNDEECYYGMPIAEEPEKKNENDKQEEQKIQFEQTEEKINHLKMKNEIIKENLENQFEEKQNIENISPEGEKYEIVKKKRRIKKTIEEMNAKGQLGYQNL